MEPKIVRDARKRGLAVSSKGVNAAAFSGGSVTVQVTNLAKVAAAATYIAPTADSTEEEFQGTVVALARDNGWEVYHTRNSEGSDPGFPDLVLCRDDKLYFAECKCQDGVESKEQKKWGRLIANVCPSRVCHFLWRPSHWPVIVKLLSAPREE